MPEAGDLGISSQWVLFNDFVVKDITEEEALSFPDKWKVNITLLVLLIALTPVPGPRYSIP